MKKIIMIIIACILLQSCNSLPQLYQAAEEMATDSAINITVSREAIQKQTDISISLDVKNNMEVVK